MTECIIIAGAGGQGIMLLGRVLAQSAMRENKHVTWLPAYGAEVRGGTAHCMVVISDEEISSPYIEQADTLIIMNQPSLEKFKARIKNKGLLIINSSLAKPDASSSRTKESKHLQRVSSPFTDLAIKLGNIKIANMVALGCFIAHRRIVNLKSVFAAIEEIAPPEKRDLIEINQEALKQGMKL